MILEGLNININDIEDDDLRKKVIKYFKTFKKGKLEDEDLAELDDENDSEENDSEENDSEENDSEEIEKLKNMPEDQLKEFIMSFDDKTKKELAKEIKSMKDNDELDDDEKEQADKILGILNGENNISENLSYHLLLEGLLSKIVVAAKKAKTRKTSKKLNELIKKNR